MEAERIVPEPEEPDEDEEDEEYGEYGDEGGDEEYGEEYGEEEEEVIPGARPVREWGDDKPDQIQTTEMDSRVFRGNEKLRKRFNEVEIDNFMKLLAIKPHVQW